MTPQDLQRIRGSDGWRRQRPKVARVSMHTEAI